MDQGTDFPRCVVIGAGVIGLASAYFLSRAGVPVTVLERGDVGCGTSSRCDGNVLAVDKDPGYDAELELKSQALLADLASILGPMEYRRPGSFLVCDGEDEVEPALEWVSRHRERGLPLEFLDRQSLHARLPDISPHVPAGLYNEGDSTLNPLLYTHRLAQAARDLGAEIRPRSPVHALEVAGGKVRAVRLENGDILGADVVVVAAGVWTPPLLAPIGVSLPIRPRQGMILVSAKGPRFGNEKVMEFGYLMAKFGRERRAPKDACAHGVALVYEPTASGNFLLGSSRRFVGFDTDPDPDVLASIARRARHFYPGMGGSTMIRSYAGLRPWTPDHFPVVSRVDGMEGLVVAAGHEGDGIGLAAVTGALVRDLVLDRPPIVDPSPLSASRFAGVSLPDADA